jgi:glycosyltransferase involved in cell wall biosynthesis
MPIVNADPRNLTMRLKELVENSQLRHELGKKGQEFVKKHHDAKVIIDQCLISIYEDSL